MAGDATASPLAFDKEEEMDHIDDSEIDAVFGGDSWAGTPDGRQAASFSSCMDAAMLESGTTVGVAFWQCVFTMNIR